MFETRAPARHIESRRQQYPPNYQSIGGWNALFGVALDLAPPNIRAMAARGSIASGEIGELTPSTYVTRQGRGYAIEMHSGMMRLIYSAARAITASDTGRFTDEQETALSGEQVATQIAELFFNYELLEIATVQEFPATKFQTDWAHSIAVCAEQFLLMHELAHVYNGDFSWLRDFFGGEKSRLAREIAADETACQWMINYILDSTRVGPQRQVFYAGAEFGLRVRMAMETVGMQFSTSHPLAGNRVAAMRQSLRKAAGARTFYKIANTSIALDQMWRSIEAKLRREDHQVFALTLDDVLAGARTLTVELVAAGPEALQIKDVPGKPGAKQLVFAPVNAKQEEIIRTAKRVYRDLAPDLRRAAGERAGDVFEPGTLEYGLFLVLIADQSK